MVVPVDIFIRITVYTNGYAESIINTDICHTLSLQVMLQK
jgi:hypothetical protein